MIKKMIYINLFFASILYAVNIEIDKDIYVDNNIIVNFSEMEGQNSEWIAIYPEGSTNDYGNIVEWKLTDAKVNGNVTFNSLPIGVYDVRVFNSATFVVSEQIKVSVNDNNDNVAKIIVETTQNSYSPIESITATFDNMPGNQEDWIGIYPAGTTNEWKNMLQWEWLLGETSGLRTFEPLPAGNYEVRLFLNNSFKLEASYQFSIEETVDAIGEVDLKLNKNVYTQNELIYINYSNMPGNKYDWIAIYPEGASYKFKNVIDYKYIDGEINGEISLAGIDALPDEEDNPGGLKAGNYEVRAMFDNSLAAKVVKTFTVREQVVTSTVYEAADGSISPSWYHLSGPTAPFYQEGRVRLRTNWIDDFVNKSEYRLLFPQKNTTQKILELDAGGIERSSHFFVGLILETTAGSRKMIWDPFFTHEGTVPFKAGQYLSYPLYIDIQRRAPEKLHVRVDVEKYLRILEPNNKVISISAFMTSGGDLDEIKLSSH